MADSLGIVILAAGKGTRLKVDIPKSLCPMLGKPLVDHVLSNLDSFQKEFDIRAKISVVVGHKKEMVKESICTSWPEITFVTQEEQKGTAHALQCYFDQNKDAWNSKYTLVVCADTPLIGKEEFSKLFKALIDDDATQASAAVFETANPTGYGRIVLEGKGFDIVEEKDADEVQKKITLVNSGLYFFRTSHIKEHLGSIENQNKSGEFYLTDLFKRSFNVKAVSYEDSYKFLGINNLVQLEQACEIKQKEIIRNHQLAGIRFLNSSSCYIEESVQLAAGTVIYPGVVLEGQTKIGPECVLESGVVVKDSEIAGGSSIFANSYLEGCKVNEKARIGPMARIRPGSKIGESCKIGNFVETKNAQLDKKVSVSHLSYVGDAKIGEGTNLGCGFITCNYDGAKKHLTTIGKNSFIGSDSQMIAPINLGDGVYVASGSTINKDIPSGGFAIARQRQVTKEGMAKKFLKKKD